MPREITLYLPHEVAGLRAVGLWPSRNGHWHGSHTLTPIHKENPNWPSQPRVPAGNPDGGQWTDGGGSGGDRGGGMGGNSRIRLPQPGREFTPNPMPPTPPQPHDIDDPPLHPALAPWEFLIPLAGARLLFGQIIRKLPGQSYYLIGGQKFSSHALDRMELRKIPPSVVINTIKNGTKLPGKRNTTAYYDSENNITTYVGNFSKKVTTLHKGKPSGVKTTYKNRLYDTKANYLYKESKMNNRSEHFFAIQRILNEDWNPIGINLKEVDDEYDSYVQALLSYNKWSRQSLYDYLLKIASETMGLGRTEYVKEDSKRVTEKLLPYLKTIGLTE